jgi:hypothetical protein
VVTSALVSKCSNLKPFANELLELLKILSLWFFFTFFIKEVGGGQRRASEKRENEPTPIDE